MVKLTGEMKEAFGKMKVFPVATATNDGMPNVIPLGIAELVSDDTVWFVDNFMNKTLSNIRSIPGSPSLSGARKIKGCYQVKGVAAIKTSGKEYDEMKAKINQKNPAPSGCSLVIVKITEIFECKPGPTAGVKIL